VASAAAAVVVGFCGEALTDRLQIPPLLVAVCGIVPLLPGLAIYRGLFLIVVEGNLPGGLEALVGALAIYRGLFLIVVEGNLPGGLEALVGALAIGLALAAGVSLGEHLGRPLGGQRDRFDRRARRRGTNQD
jgi:uncharacterized membrane protein YjjB (DUF3815 family)